MNGKIGLAAIVGCTLVLTAGCSAAGSTSATSSSAAPAKPRQVLVSLSKSGLCSAAADSVSALLPDPLDTVAKTRRHCDFITAGTSQAHVRLLPAGTFRSVVTGGAEPMPTTDVVAAPSAFSRAFVASDDVLNGVNFSEAAAKLTGGRWYLYFDVRPNVGRDDLVRVFEQVMAAYAQRLHPAAPATSAPSPVATVRGETGAGVTVNGVSVSLRNCRVAFKSTDAGMAKVFFATVVADNTTAATVSPPDFTVLIGVGGALGSVRLGLDLEMAPGPVKPYQVAAWHGGAAPDVAAALDSQPNGPVSCRVIPASS